MKVLFLDVDGVLNNENSIDKIPGGYTCVSDVLIRRLQRIIETTSAKIVLSSTWRVDWNIDDALCGSAGRYLNRELNKYNMCVTDKIVDRISCYRGSHIKKYLETHSCITDYVIIDDYEFDFLEYDDLQQHFVQTDLKLGLSEDDVNRAIEILGKD